MKFGASGIPFPLQVSRFVGGLQARSVVVAQKP